MMKELKRVTSVIPVGHWPTMQMVGVVTLIYADRCRRRIRLIDDSGAPFLLDLERPALLLDGDGLQLMDRGFIKVVAATEALTEAHAKDARHLAQLAWHVGNRHTASEIIDDQRLRLLDNAVLSAMLKGLGAKLSAVEAPFNPEGGAYAGGAVGSHGHEHGPHTHTH